MSSNHFISNDIEVQFSGQRSINTTSLSGDSSGFCATIALSVEFVAKPQEVQRLPKLIPSSLTKVLQFVSGFAGCLVMVSDQEARLVTVITLWAGEDARKKSTENARWVQTLLAPFIDRQLRVQFLITFVEAQFANSVETHPVAERSGLQPWPVQRQEVCAA
jgi:hypothetical protein